MEALNAMQTFVESAIPKLSYALQGVTFQTHLPGSKDLAHFIHAYNQTAKDVLEQAHHLLHRYPQY